MIAALERWRERRAAAAWHGAWVRRLALPLPPAPRAMPEWQATDAATLARFLSHNATGQKLATLGRQYEAELLAAAVLSEKAGDARAYACGFAAGFRGAWAYLQQLSVLQPPHPLNDAPPPTTPGDEDEREQP